MEGSVVRTWLHPRFEGKSVYFAGKLKYAGYYGAVLVKAAGGVVADAVKAGVDLVVCGESGAASAEKQAAKLKASGAKIDVIDEPTFIGMVMPTRDEGLATLRTGGAAVPLLMQALMCDRTRKLDLARADLSGIDLSNLALQQITLDGANLSGSTLVRTQLGFVNGLVLDGADLSGGNLSIGGRCSFKGAKLVGTGIFGKADGCDFEGAIFGAAQLPLLGSNINLRGATLDGAMLWSSSLVDCDLSGASLVGATLHECNLKGAKLVGARLDKAVLEKVELGGADLSSASLKGAIVWGCMLTGARVDGADFSSALVGSDLTGVAREAAIGLAPPPVVGPHLQALDLEAKGRSPTVIFDADAAGVPWRFTAREATLEARGARSTYIAVKGLSMAVLQSAYKCHGARPIFDAMMIHTSPPADAAVEARLRAALVRALHEAFGLPQPSDEALARYVEGQADYRERLVREDLRGGPEGIARFNKRTSLELERAGRFDGAKLAGLALGGVKLTSRHLAAADLSGCDLADADLSNTDLTGAVLSNAKLKGAKMLRATLPKARLDGIDGREARLDATSLKGASLKAADLSGAWLPQADLTRADLTGANLGKANLMQADLRGAKLTDATLDEAKLTDAKYDAKTVFPKGFSPPIDMKWAGSGANPYFKPQAAPEVEEAIDMATLVARVRDNTQHQAYFSGLQMLKSERFRLFSDVAGHEVVGVIRSQSDKELLYSCRLGEDGSFSCCTQNLKPCGGMRGKVCKHIVVMVLGLAKGGALPLGAASRFIIASRPQKPSLDKEKMSATFLRYQQAQQGEIDWRPTETVPEDYLTL